MSMETTMLYLYVETPLHAGVGSGLSSIDLPIQRERPTQYPMIQGSGIKGKLRATAEEMAERKIAPFTQDHLVDIIFGPKDGSEHAGALIAGDARILLFPVRSLSGVFAYTTSYDVLNRFARDIIRGNGSVGWQLEKQLAEDTAHITQGSKIAISGNVVLEEFSYKAEHKPQVDRIADWLAASTLPQKEASETDAYAYWRSKVRDSLVILPDEDFRDFVVNATEIITRISIDRATKTAAGRALWTEEHLPTDTLLYVPIYATNARKVNGKREPEMLAKDILNTATQLENGQRGYLQLGGDETVGRGMVRMHWGSKK